LKPLNAIDEESGSQCKHCNRRQTEDVMVFNEELFATGASMSSRFTVWQFNVNEAPVGKIRLTFCQHRDRILDMLKNFVEGNQVKTAGIIALKKVGAYGVNLNNILSMGYSSRVRIHGSASPTMFFHFIQKNA
jgi:hypothetical protein